MSKTTNKKTKLAILLLAALLLIFGGVYAIFGPKTTAGQKEITLEVIDNAEKSTAYTVKTEAEKLIEAMEDAEGLDFSGSESQYGLTLETINGLTADFTVDNAYWAIELNGEPTNFGISDQPVQDGEHYQFIYTVFK